MDGASQDGVSKPARTMDDITRLFMSGARDVSQARRLAPTGAAATGDAGKSVPVKTEQPRAAEPAAPGPAADDAAGATKLPAVQLAVSPLAGDGAWAALEAAARHIAAEQGVGVALVGVDKGVMRLMRAGASRHGILAVAGGSAKGRGEGAIDVQIARAMYGLRENVELWLVALPFGPAMDHLLAEVRDWLLVCGTDNEAVIAGYRAIKNLVSGDPVDEARRMRLFLSCDDFAEAAVVHGRLRRAAGEFLKQELPLAGMTAKAPTGIEGVAEFVLGTEAAAAWSSVGEFLHDLCGEQHGDEGEAELSSPEPMLTALHVEPETPMAEETAVPETPPEPVVAAASLPVAAAAEKPAAVSVKGARVIEVAALTTDAQWSVVLGSAAEIVGGEVMEARPPREAHGAIVLDQAGKLHVWTMARDATSWAALWSWAREHRQILALTRQDRWVDAAADVRLHVVLPAEAERTTGEGLPGMSWYRVLPVRWGERLGATVVGI